MENINSEVIEGLFEVIQEFAGLCGLKIVSAIPPEIKYTPMYSIKELEKLYTVCDFNGECDVCDNPKGKTFVVGYSNDENGDECDSYICQKCASIGLDNWKDKLKSDSAK